MKRIISFLIILCLMFPCAAWAENFQMPQTLTPEELDWDEDGIVDAIDYYDENGKLFRSDTYIEGELDLSTFYVPADMEVEGYDEVLYNITYSPDGTLLFITLSCNNIINTNDGSFSRPVFEALLDTEYHVIGQTYYIYSESGSILFDLNFDAEGNLTKYMDWDAFEEVTDPDPDALPFDLDAIKLPVIVSNP